jgi:hypothetical protein
MYMLIDSGAGTTWVMGSTCQSTACGMHNSFGPSDSTTYTTTSKTFSINYGSGSVGGSLVQDTLNVAGMKTSMTFGVANKTSDDFVHFPFDGILGLSMNTGATDNFWQVLKQNKVLTSNIFGITLGRSSDGTNTGEITFGSTNPSRYTGSISYTNVSTAAGGDWAIPLGDMGYNGNSAKISGRLGYIDTGTSYAFGPAADVAAIHKLIPGANSTDGVTYTVPCSSNLAITVTFSGVTYNISSKDWLLSNGNSCTSNIFGHEVVSGQWLFGDLFLKNVYTVFDADASRIGFAPKVASTASASSTTTGTSGQSTATTLASQVTGVSPTTTQPSSMLGLSGHETSVTTGTAVAATSGASQTTATQASPGEQLDSNKYISILCIVAVIALVA